MKGTVAFALIVAAACNSGIDSETPPVQLGPIEVVPPAGWVAQELGPMTRQWTPRSNQRRESITVIVAPKPLGDTERVFDQTRKAQDMLRDVRITASTTISGADSHGGRRLDLTFRPEGSKRLYKRSHVTLVEGDHVVHVLYTATDPDPERAALNGVVASVQEGG
jgi:hypothetical protein